MIVKKLAMGYEQIYIVILKKLNMVCKVWVVIWSFDFFSFMLIYFILLVFSSNKGVVLCLEFWGSQP